MSFEFATATRIVFGSGKLNDIAALVQAFGTRAMIITRPNPTDVDRLLERLNAAGIDGAVFTVDSEPTVDLVNQGVQFFHQNEREFVISIGGGSVIDSGKAIAALATNPGHPLDYLEVIGKGHKLTEPPVPFVAIPTTAGTGAEVTKNAVLASPEHRVKVSLRSPLMLANLALVDPELTYSMPQAVTASTGMDAITQVLEPYVSHLATPLTDGFALEGLRRGPDAITRAYDHPNDTQAREDMALTSLLGGLALANAKLGAVHGFAGVLGGMYHAPHGAICATLLPHVMTVNIAALRQRDAQNPALDRYGDIAVLCTGDIEAEPEDGAQWAEDLRQRLGIQPLTAYGVQPSDYDTIIEKSQKSSSMKGNPLPLTAGELREILERAG
jgi:alcohol dehydrogenase class IV